MDVSGGGRWKIWQNAGTKLMLPFLEMEICWLLWQEMQDIRSSGLLQMISGRWKCSKLGVFHDNNSAKCDPAVSGGSPRPVGRMVFDIPDMEDASGIQNRILQRQKL